MHSGSDKNNKYGRKKYFKLNLENAKKYLNTEKQKTNV